MIDEPINVPLFQRVRELNLANSFAEAQAKIRAGQITVNGVICRNATGVVRETDNIAETREAA